MRARTASGGAIELLRRISGASASDLELEGEYDDEWSSDDEVLITEAEGDDEREDMAVDEAEVVAAAAASDGAAVEVEVGGSSLRVVSMDVADWKDSESDGDYSVTDNNPPPPPPGDDDIEDDSSSAEA